MIQRAYLLLHIFVFGTALMSMKMASQEVEDESEFNYIDGSEYGPGQWGNIRPDWRICRHGLMQSPVDLMTEQVHVVSHLGSFSRNYKAASAILKNRGHDIMLKWEGDAGFILINSTRYMLRQCHWHSPSEHAIDGKRFDLELHLVHESPNGEVAVVGLMYEYGEPNNFISLITDHLGAISESSKTEKAIGVIDPKGIKLGIRKYFRYTGSLTTPPCTQNVQWIILHKVRTVAREQVMTLRGSVKDDAEFNARPLQPMNGRNIQLYKLQENDSKHN